MTYGRRNASGVPYRISVNKHLSLIVIRLISTGRAKLRILSGSVKNGERPE